MLSSLVSLRGTQVLLPPPPCYWYSPLQPYWCWIIFTEIIAFWCCAFYQNKHHTTKMKNPIYNNLVGHLVHRCPPQTIEWGWGCPWSSSTPQTSPSSSRSCWSGSSPYGQNIEQKKSLEYIITLALRVVPVTCWMSNQNPWLFGSGFKPSTAFWYFSSAFKKWGQERTEEKKHNVNGWLANVVSCISIKFSLAGLSY